jgi:hypothetical protein
MRLGNVVLLVSLCLGLGAFEAGILKAILENDAGIIDPLGSPSTDEAGEIDPWGKPRVDGAGHIDPWGTPSTDEAGQIDPWGGSGR